MHPLEHLQVEHYDGIGWSEQTDTPIFEAGGAGTQTAIIWWLAGGNNYYYFEYNGSSWTSGIFNTARSFPVAGTKQHWIWDAPWR